jgi:hypothetical protein
MCGHLVSKPGQLLGHANAATRVPGHGNTRMEIILIFGALLGVIPAVIATKKGRSFFGWWLFGVAWVIVALPDRKPKAVP